MNAMTPLGCQIRLRGPYQRTVCLMLDRRGPDTLARSHRQSLSPFWKQLRLDVAPYNTVRPCSKGSNLLDRADVVSMSLFEFFLMLFADFIASSMVSSKRSRARFRGSIYVIERNGGSGEKNLKKDDVLHNIRPRKAPDNALCAPLLSDVKPTRTCLKSVWAHLFLFTKKKRRQGFSLKTRLLFFCKNLNGSHRGKVTGGAFMSAMKEAT